MKKDIITFSFWGDRGRERERGGERVTEKFSGAWGGKSVRVHQL